MTSDNIHRQHSFQLDYSNTMFSGCSEEGGEIKLRAAVLLRAISDYQARWESTDWGFKGAATRRSAQYTAAHWMRTDRLTDSFSSRECCESLGLSPEAVRMKVFAGPLDLSGSSGKKGARGGDRN